MKTNESTPTSYRHVAATLRREWSAGVWHANLRVPSHDELCRRFKTTRVTIQRAMDLLTEQGFLITRAKTGRYLAPHAPHLHRYGLAFAGHPETEIHSWKWTQRMLALYLAAQRMGSISIYLDAFPHAPGWARLRRDVEDQALAGLIFAYSPEGEILNTPLLKHVSIPFASTGGIGARVTFRREDFFTITGKWLCARERIRTAVVATPMLSPEHIISDLTQSGLRTDPAWVMAAHWDYPDWIRHTLPSILSAGAKRPNALVVMDDHLLKPVLQTLEQLGVAVPDDLTVVSMWNFPLPYTLKTKVQLIGYDAAEWLKACMAQIDLTHKTGRNPPERLVPPRCMEDI